jgi:glycine cleavage system H protein
MSLDKDGNTVGADESMNPEYLEITIDKFILRVKNNLRYSPGHVWIGEENQQYVVGLTDYAQRKGGDILFIEFTKEKSLIKAGDPIATYETIKAVLDVPAPFDCEIAATNDALENQPEFMNEDPYGEGWLAHVKPVKPDSVETLLTPERYFELMKKEAESIVS